MDHLLSGHAPQLLGGFWHTTPRIKQAALALRELPFGVLPQPQLLLQLRPQTGQLPLLQLCQRRRMPMRRLIDLLEGRSPPHAAGARSRGGNSGSRQLLLELRHLRLTLGGQALGGEPALQATRQLLAREPQLFVPCLQAILAGSPVVTFGGELRLNDADSRRAFLRLLSLAGERERELRLFFGGTHGAVLRGQRSFKHADAVLLHTGFLRLLLQRFLQTHQQLVQRRDFLVLVFRNPHRHAQVGLQLGDARGAGVEVAAQGL
mmetsp:Transcript_11898/g.38274  ORF Transcript_11898/g.38274 Transcript_11898/m.38274 type:complete len:263 (+) Transcript_11898:643-1431(+)